MKPKTLVFFIFLIVLAFLIHGAFLISDIQEINKILQCSSGLTSDNLKNFSDHLDQFQYFLYLFAVLIGSISLSLIRLQKDNLPSKKEAVKKILKIKKRAKVESQLI